MKVPENKRFDAAIIGVGQAGNPLAKKLVNEGWHIAVIEKDLEGGSCINYGCTPTKTMIASAKAAYIARNSDNWGITTGNVQANFKDVIQRRNKIVDVFRKSTTEFLEETENITFFRGTASFTGQKTLAITSNTGDTETIQANKIFINTGTNPKIPAIEGLNDVEYHTAKTWMEIETLPEHLIIIGGGYIGLEFSQMFQRLGSRVTLLQDGPQLMLREDEDIAEMTRKILVNEGVDIQLNAIIQQAQKKDGSIEISYSVEGAPKTVKGTHLLVAVGTGAAIKSLNPEIAGIAIDEKGYIKVNEKMETSTEGIFALGDVKGGPEFTHISYDDYRILENHLFGDDTRFLSNRPVPYTLFTDPQLGRVGFNEKMAKKSNVKYRIAKMEAKYIARTIETGNDNGLLKVLIADNDTILGASLLMDEGGEIMSALQIAMMGIVTYQQLRDGVFAHPTYVEGFNSLFSDV